MGPRLTQSGNREIPANPALRFCGVMWVEKQLTHPGAVQLLWRVDHGEALAVAGIPDAVLRNRLEQLFVALGLRRTSKVGVLVALLMLSSLIAQFKTV